jgi:hypothetical protein
MMQKQSCEQLYIKKLIQYTCPNKHVIVNKYQVTEHQVQAVINYNHWVIT